MKKYVATALILLAGTAAGWSQTAIPCSPTDPQADAAGGCPATGPTPSATNVLRQNQMSIDPNTILVNPPRGGGIARPRTSRGMRLVVPNDPLGAGATNVNPFGGGSIGSNSNITGGGMVGSSRIGGGMRIR
jgi:hypothetical protein